MSQIGGSSSRQSSSVSTQQTNVFDVSSEKSTLSLLHALHRTPLDSDTKNNLRDSLFIYRQNKNEEIFEELVTAFATNGFSVENGALEKEIVVEKPTITRTHFGHHRTTPVFTRRDIDREVKGTTKDVAMEATSKDKQEKYALKSILKPTNNQKSNDSQPVVQEAEKPKSVPINKNFVERIKEIKKLVNQKVGNPVSLIDVDNEIGREYMNSLLSAMKLANGGKHEDLQKSMERLEKAFTQVESLDLSKSISQESVTKIVVEGKKEVPPIVESADDIKSTVLKNNLPIRKQSTNQQKESNTNISPFVTSPETQDVSTVPSNSKSFVEARASETKNSSTLGTKISSVAKEKQLQELMQSNRSKEVQKNQKLNEDKISAMDPLMVPNVTAGLNQLLSEWSLFKSSGFFGTGPSGADHVLYKKLQKLTMAAVIAGRFEGATPQIKQSITDYMNGWRYEEGVVHEHAETFEHYLRRVIKHILGKNKT